MDTHEEPVSSLPTQCSVSSTIHIYSTIVLWVYQVSFNFGLSDVSFQGDM